MLALKLILVPLSLLIVSMSGKWWGPSMAGWLAALPVVAGPILFLLVLAHGPAFGARAATLALSAVLTLEAYNFAYAWSCRSRSWQVSLGIGLAAWLVSAFAISLLPVSPWWAALVALVAVCFGQSFLPRSSAVAASSPLTRTDLAGRMFAGAALTICVTSLSSWTGPAWSGLLAVFPVLGTTLTVSSHRAHGPEYVISLVRGMVLGRFSFAAFCLVLAVALTHQPPSLVFLAAAICAMLTQWVTSRFTKRRRASATEEPEVITAD